MSIAIRDALLKADVLIAIASFDEGVEIDEVKKIKSEIKSALKKNLRNCEVGTPEEQYNRFIYCCTNRKFPCIKSYTKGCIQCYAKWSQMPYEEVK